MSEQEEKGIETSGTPVEVISVVDWDGVMGESLSDEQYVKLVVDLKPITQEQASGLMAAVMGYGVPLTEEEQAEAKERYGNWQDDVLTPIKLASVELPEMSEEQLAFVREWVEGMLMSPESVKMIGEYMDRKAEAQQRLWGGYVSYVNGDGGEERISLMEEEERAIDDWWKDEKGEI